MEGIDCPGRYQADIEVVFDTQLTASEKFDNTTSSAQPTTRRGHTATIVIRTRGSAVEASFARWQVKLDIRRPRNVFAESLALLDCAALAYPEIRQPPGVFLLCNET